MATRVGEKGQVVIEKAIRDRLGVEPGSLAVQHVVGDHVEIRFLPPRHSRSLRGVLKPPPGVTLPPEQWQEARARAWEDAARESVARWEAPAEAPSASRRRSGAQPAARRRSER